MFKNAQIRKIISLVVLLTVFTCICPLFTVNAANVYQATWTSVNQHNPGGTAPEWFKDAKFGIYFHWGPYSVPAFGSEWYPKYMYETNTGNYAYHISHYGDPFTNWPYQNFMNGAYDKNGNWTQFSPKLKSTGGSFDPDEWAQLFADAGAKFAGPAAEHSDGWSNWNSSVNEWNSVNKGPHLDLVGLLTNAIRSKNLKTVVTMHHAYAIGGGYYTNVPYQSDPSLQKLYSQLSWNDEMNLYVNKLKEIIDGYQPDIIWQDSGTCNMDEWARLQFLSYYYNKAIDWGKEVVATAKDGFNNDCTVQDFERGGPADLTTNYWLTDDSISPSTWSYTEGMPYYTTTQLLHALIDHVSKNGNLLLNIAPKADGTIPQEQKNILLSMGDWLKKYGEAIYSTRAWVIYGEGPTIMGGGHFSEMKTGTSQDIRFTRNKNNNILYAIVLGWPGDGANLKITSLSSGRINLGTLTNVQLLGNTAGSYISLNRSQDSTGLNITMPAAKPYQADAYVVKLSFSGQIPQLGSPGTPAGATFYDDNFSGNPVTLGPGTYGFSQMLSAGIHNDSISSISVPNGYKVTCYEHDLSGRSWVFTSDADYYTLLSLGANDIISSMKVESTADPNTYYKIVNRTNGMALDSSGNVPLGSYVKQAPYDGGTNMQWQIIDVGGGYYKVVNRSNGMVLDSGGLVQQGSYLKQWTWDGSTNLQWQVIDTGGGYFRLVNRTNGMVIDSGGNVPSGSYAKQWSWDGSTNLQWQLERLP